MKIGVMFGSPETTTGGNALKFYSSVRLDVRRVGAIKVGEQAIGNRTRVKVVKNKMAAPFATCEFDILFNEGISRSGDALDLASELGVVEKSGAWFSYKGERIGQGRDNARLYIKDRPEMLAEIERSVLAQKGISVPGGPSATGNDADAAEAKDGKSDTEGRAKAAQRPRPRA
jgi:recombination protein RecA